MVAIAQNNRIAHGVGYGRYRLGMLVGLASVVMLFTSLTSAYIVRAAVTNDWVPLPMPRVLWFGTALLLFSSFSLESARRALKHHAGSHYRRLLVVTVLLGAGFLVSQLLGWRQLVRQGIYISSNPHGSFFYLLTAVHALHLAGGMLLLVYLLFRHQGRRFSELNVEKRAATAGAVALYWHFMDALWIYLFLLLFLWK